MQRFLQQEGLAPCHMNACICMHTAVHKSVAEAQEALQGLVTLVDECLAQASQQRGLYTALRCC